jgi:hypothetical protein
VLREGLWERKNAGPAIIEELVKIDEKPIIRATKVLNAEAVTREDLVKTADPLDTVYDSADTTYNDEITRSYIVAVGRETA